MARRLAAGFCQVDDPQIVPSGLHVWFTPDHHMFFGWNADTTQDRPLIMQLHPAEGELENDAKIRAHVEAAHRFCTERGLDILAVTCGEEYWLRPGDPDRFAWADHMVDRINVALRELKRAFPAAITLQLEPFFNNDRTYGPGYYNPVFDCEVLALDPYLFADGSSKFFSQHLPLTASSGPDMRAKFALEIATPYEHAVSYGKPILMMPQAFRGMAGPQDEWRTAPTPQQLRWWFDLAQRLPSVVAVSYFCRQTLHPSIQGLDHLHAQRAEVERELREMGYAT